MDRERIANEIGVEEDSIKDRMMVEIGGNVRGHVLFVENWKFDRQIFFSTSLTLRFIYKTKGKPR